MKWPINWKKPRVVAQQQPPEGGRAELFQTENDINIQPIPRGIRRDFQDLTHGTITPYGVVEFPPYADQVAMPHVNTPRGIIATRLVLKAVDDKVNVPSVFIGND